MQSKKKSELLVPLLNPSLLLVVSNSSAGARDLHWQLTSVQWSGQVLGPGGRGWASPRRNPPAEPLEWTLDRGQRATTASPPQQHSSRNFLAHCPPATIFWSIYLITHYHLSPPLRMARVIKRGLRMSYLPPHPQSLTQHQVSLLLSTHWRNEAGSKGVGKRTLKKHRCWLEILKPGRRWVVSFLSPRIDTSVGGSWRSRGLQ